MTDLPRIASERYNAGNSADVYPNGVRFKGICKRYDGAEIPAVNFVSLAVRKNEFFTLLGPSGCGKTTLLRLVSGLEQQDSGSIEVDGTILDNVPPYRRPVNTVFQSYAIFPHMSVTKNIAFGLEMKGVSRADINRRVEELLELVALGGLGARMPHQLSGGQQQRVALARALASRPKVLLLDEPLAALDLKLRNQMQAELKRLQKQLGITFIFVTHDQQEALTMSDRVAVMSNGEILQLGTPEDIYERPSCRFVAEFIGEMNFIEARNIGGGGYRLKCGAILRGLDQVEEKDVVLALRPERASIASEGKGALVGEVKEIVYLGNDQAISVKISGDLTFRVRIQNKGARRFYEIGEVVSIDFPADAVRVLTS